MGGMGMRPAPMNVNQQLIRPLLLNATVVLLFVLPMITMRTYAEEKRSGTIELLLTSPLTDLQIILGKFLGALALYAAMLGVTLVYIGGALRLRQPGVEADRHRAIWACCCSAAASSRSGLLISSLTKNQIVAGMLTFGVFLLLWVIDWIGTLRSGRRASDRQLPVDHAALRRLRQGRHRHEARRLLRELHHLRPVPDRQVGRQRAVAGIMVKRIGGIIGWVGTALVFAAVAIRFLRPGGTATRTGARGPAWSASWSTRSASGATSRRVPPAPDAPRHAHGGEHRHRPRHPRRHQLARRAAEQALGPDEARQFTLVGPDDKGPAEARRAAEDHGLREDPGDGAVQGPPAGVRVCLEAGGRSSTSIPTGSRPSPSSIRCSPTARWCSSTRAAPSAWSATASRT